MLDQGLAQQVLGPIYPYQNGESFLLRVAFFFRLNQTIPNFLVHRAGPMNGGDTVESRYAAEWQDTLAPEG